MRGLPETENVLRRRVYSRAKSDTEAAAALGMSAGGFRGWRLRQGLPSKAAPNVDPADYWAKIEALGEHAPRLDEIARQSPQDALMVAAYRETISDASAGRRLGLTDDQVRHWRTKHAIPPKQKRFLHPAERQRRLRAWVESPDAVAAAKQLGLPWITFWEWMRQEGLASKKGITSQPKTETKSERYLRAYERSRNDAEAGSLVGIPTRSFIRWRRSQGLVPTGFHHRAVVASKRKQRLGRARA